MFYNLLNIFRHKILSKSFQNPPSIATLACVASGVFLQSVLTRVACNYQKMESPHRPLSAESVSVGEEKEKPWKYVGYKVFSRWVASDPSFFVLRRFGTLNARVALSLQDEIAQLEEKLDFMDKRYSSRDIPDVHNGTFRLESFEDDDDRRTLIRDTLPKKLAKYSMYLRP
jgi:hypothetical protein